MTFLAVLASSPSNSTSTISNVEPGLLGFLVVAALGVALVFILRSMNKQFKKIGPRPEDPEDVGADESWPDDDEAEAAAADPAAAKRR
ncbi:MAG TPA: hypothetical protein VIH85_28100 [Solirubrobacteraceae bacterium]